MANVYLKEVCSDLCSRRPHGPSQAKDPVGKMPNRVYEPVVVLRRGHEGFQSDLDLSDMEFRKDRRQQQGWCALRHKPYRPLGTPDLLREKKQVERVAEEMPEREIHYGGQGPNGEGDGWEEDGQTQVVPSSPHGNGFGDLKREVMESEERMLGVRGGSTFLEMMRRQDRAVRRGRLPDIHANGGGTDRGPQRRDSNLGAAGGAATARGGASVPTTTGSFLGRRPSMGAGSRTESFMRPTRPPESPKGSPRVARESPRAGSRGRDKRQSGGERRSPERGGGTPRRTHTLMPDIPALRAPRQPGRAPAPDQFPVGGGRGLMPPPRFGLATGPQSLELDPAVTVQERLIEFDNVRSDMNKKLSGALSTLQTERTDNYHRKFVSFRVQKEYFNPVRWRLQAERYKIEAQLHNIETHPWYSRLVHMVTENGRTMTPVEQDIVLEVKTVVEMGRAYGVDHFYELTLKLTRDALDNTEVQKVMNFLREEVGLAGEEYKKFLQHHSLPIPFHLKRDGSTKAAAFFTVARGLVRAGLQAQQRHRASVAGGDGEEGAPEAEGGVGEAEEAGGGGEEGGAPAADGGRRELAQNFAAHFGAQLQGTASAAKGDQV